MKTMPVTPNLRVTFPNFLKVSTSNQNLFKNVGDAVDIVNAQPFLQDAASGVVELIVG